ncbi:MAG: hypothetical protein KAV44_00740 [Bacteroidales bacterium]|nr:hypothetical protein [Bacteroidales bacterium]
MKKQINFPKVLTILYVIIDKDGKVIDDKAKCPGNEEVAKEINALL